MARAHSVIKAPGTMPRISSSAPLSESTARMSNGAWIGVVSSGSSKNSADSSLLWAKSVRDARRVCLLALLAKELAAEPLELMLECRKLEAHRTHVALQGDVRLRQSDDLLGRPLGGLGKGRNGGGVRRRHGVYFTVEPSIHAGCTGLLGNLKRRLVRAGSMPSSKSLSPVQSI